jgi:hypothetical protein
MRGNARPPTTRVVASFAAEAHIANLGCRCGKARGGCPARNLVAKGARSSRSRGMGPTPKFAFSPPPGREHVARTGGPPMRITSNTGRTSKRRASFCDTPPERARRGAALVYMGNLTPTSRRPRRRSSREIACRLFGFDRGVFKEKLTYGNITRLQQHEDLVRDGGFWFVPPRWEGGASLHDDRAVVRKICRVVGCVIF